MKKVKVLSFVNQFAAFVTGDTATVQGEKNYRRADSALKTQIARLKGDVISLEDKIETAKEKAKNALVNFGNPIADDGRDAYVEQLIRTDNELKKAEKDLEKHNATIAFLEIKLAEVNEEAQENA